MTVVANRLTLPFFQLVLETGLPAVGYKYKFYLTGGSTPASVYTTVDLTGPVTSVTLNALGFPAGDIFLDPAVNYRMTVTDSLDTVLYTYDNLHDLIFATGSYGRFKLYNGNPNGNVAGTAGSVGGANSDAIFDTSSNILWICTTTGSIATAVWTNITATLAGSVSLSGVLSPTSFNTNQDNYNPTNLSTASTLRLNPDASVNITGLAGGSIGRVMVIHNINATFNFTLAHQSSSSTAANRFTLANGHDVVMKPGYSAILQYDAVTGTWRMASGPMKLSAGSAMTMENVAFSVTAAANILTIALKTAAGADPTPGDPCWVGFRSTTADSGDYDLVAITTALSLVISSGSTLGFVASETNVIHVGFINNVGVAELCASRDPSLLTTDRVINTTAEGGAGAADSAFTVYSTSTRASLAARLAAVILIQTGATPGQWPSPTRVTVVGSDPARPFKNTIKATAVVNGNGGTLRDAINISSITDGGSGDLTVTYGTAMSFAVYVAPLSAIEVTGSTRWLSIYEDERLTGSMRIHCQTGGGAGADPGSGGYMISALGF